MLICLCLAAHSCLALCNSMDGKPTRLLCPFSIQEHWSGLPCPPPGDLPNPGIKPKFPTLWADSLLSATTDIILGGSPRTLE